MKHKGAFALALAGALATSTLRAQTSAERGAVAQSLFDEAMKLIKAGRAADACPKLEESQRLDPGMATQYRLAECYEATNRVASAWSQYIEVADAARAERNKSREEIARKRANALEKKLSRLVVNVPREARVDGLDIKRDALVLGAPLWGTPIPTDAGDHVIVVSAPGKKTWRSTVHVGAAGSTTEVAIPKLEDAPPAATEPSREKADRTETAPPQGGDASMWNKQRIAAVAVGAGGVVGVAVGAIFGLKASSDWNETKKNCPTFHGCTKAIADQGARASTEATVSSIGFIGGGVLVAGAAVLFFTAPKAKSAKLEVTPALGVGYSGASLRGAF